MHAWLNLQPREFCENWSHVVLPEISMDLSFLSGLEHLHLTVSGTVNNPVSMSGRMGAVPSVPLKALNLHKLVFDASAVLHVPTFDESAWPEDFSRRLLNSLVKNNATPVLETMMYRPYYSTVHPLPVLQLSEEQLAWSQRLNLFASLGHDEMEGGT
jgi:hypothetical protein